ncbi:MAG: hypothetical protein ACPG51_09070 [Thiolinea sp.]
MKLDKLLELQGQFLADYPEGFNDPEMQKVRKKHNVDKLTEQAQDAFTEAKFGDPEAVIQSMIQIVGRSSMVSMFEKPRFRDAVGTSLPETRELMVDGLYEFLHGNQEKGFNILLEELVTMKLAKWSLISILPFYYAPTENWFIKPNTTKAILKHFEIESLVYKPRPSYAFYRDYSALLTEMKDNADPNLGVNNAAFTGFLMMTIM